MTAEADKKGACGMTDAVQITGNVAYPVMIDPGVWIFDERRVDMDTVFDEAPQEQSDREYEAMGRAFDEQRQGAEPPKTNGNKIKINRKDLTEKSLGMSLEPFFGYAEPGAEASRVRVHRNAGEDQILPLDTVRKSICAFSKKGEPLKEDGPLHLYFGDGSNRADPITHVYGFTIVK
ncbi:hypothetical protein [Alkalicoccus urumqiensis]|uniref:Peptidyl-prolyl cis-trans isomerase n=1 Tax=Alkalicoccus urumqiensis TaxID=1548213 RepID=A0A2P6MET2_ALKUR|nr:hypothetical protein [Alkalicoccus urumqiensis]PRO64757.1 hypothetical protein C6I21_12665 [Alkalicoccus urumqiensis]